MTGGSQKLRLCEKLKDQAEFIMYGTIMLSYQNFFNYTDQMHNIYSLHIVMAFLLHVLVLQHHQGELCVLYFKPHAVMQLLYVYMVTAVVTL
jgi:hypothetical protein